MSKLESDVHAKITSLKFVSISNKRQCTNRIFFSILKLLVITKNHMCVCVRMLCVCACVCACMCVCMRLILLLFI